MYIELVEQVELKKKGTSYTFITPEEDKYAVEIIKVLKNTKNQISKELEELVKQYEEKKKKGLVQSRGLTGYFGSGFKFDNKEGNKKILKNKDKKKAMGLDDSDNEENDKQKITSSSNSSENVAKAKEFADKVTQKSTNPNNQEQSNQNNNEITGHFTDQIEINDYSQAIRIKVTQKDNLKTNF